MPLTSDLGSTRLLLADALTGGLRTSGWNDDNVDTVFALASAHAVAPSLAAVVLARPSAPPAWRQRARAAWIDATRQSELALQEAAPIVGALSRAGVRTLLIKGAALRLAVGLPAGLRHSEDVDLWIDPRAASAASDVFDAAALPVAPWVDAPAFSGRPRGESMRVSFHQLPDRRLSSGFYLDPNVRLWGADRQPAQTFDAVWARRQSVRLAGVPLAIPALDDQLWILTAHAVVHHGLQPAMFTRHVADWQVLDRSGASVESARALAPNLVSRLALDATRAAIGRVQHAVEQGDAELLPILFAPAPDDTERWLCHADRLASVRGLARDLVERPAALRHKAWPHDRWMRHALGLDTATPVPRGARLRRLLGMRWRSADAPAVEG